MATYNTNNVREAYVAGTITRSPTLEQIAVWGYTESGALRSGFPVAWPPTTFSGHYHGITIDVSDEGIYVAGVGPGAGMGLDTYLVRYDFNGTMLWKGQFNNPDGKLDDTPVRILVNPHACTVYVVGTTETMNNSSDYYIAGFEKTTGNLLGNMIIDGGRGIADTAVDAGWTNIAEREGGAPITGVFVTGTSYDPVNAQDYLTVAVADISNCEEESDFVELWRDRYHHADGPAGSVDEAASLTVIDNHGVVVTGASQADPVATGTVKPDIVTILYAVNPGVPTGHRYWVNRWNGDGNSTDFPRRVHALRGGATSMADNYIYVTGGSYRGDSFDFDIATIAIKPEQLGGGTLAWDHYYRPGNFVGEDIGMDVITVDAGAGDDKGGVYVTGKQTDQVGNTAFVTYRLKRTPGHTPPFGQMYWPFPHVQIFDTNGQEEPTTIAIIERSDNSYERSDIIVTGRGSSPLPGTTVRYMQCPVLGGCEPWW